MQIREIPAAEIAHVYPVIAHAFEESGESEDVVRLVEELAADPTFLARYSLAAEEDGEIIGYVCLARVFGPDDEPQLILAPLAVAPDHQRSGVGTALVLAALHAAREAGEHMLFVYGDPAYYGRFDFTANATGGITPPAPRFFSPGWQAVVLGDRAPSEAAGPLRVPAALQPPEMWVGPAE